MKEKWWIKWLAGMLLFLLTGGSTSYVTVPKLYELGMHHVWKPIIDEQQQTRFAIERSIYWQRVLSYQHDDMTLDEAIELVNTEDRDDEPEEDDEW